MSDSINAAVVGGQEQPMQDLDRDLQELNRLEDNLQPPDNFHKRYTSYHAALEPAQTKKMQQAHPAAIDAGGSPENPTPGGVGVQSSRRAFTVVNSGQGDQESFVYKEPEMEMQFGQRLNTPSPPKRKKSEKQKKVNNSSNGKMEGTSNSNQVGLFDRCLRWISCRKNIQRG